MVQYIRSPSGLGCVPCLRVSPAKIKVWDRLEALKKVVREYSVTVFEGLKSPACRLSTKSQTRRLWEPTSLVHSTLQQQHSTSSSVFKYLTFSSATIWRKFSAFKGLS